MTDTERVARACDLNGTMFYDGFHNTANDPNKIGVVWNPQTRNADCAYMCAALMMISDFLREEVLVSYGRLYFHEDYADHPGETLTDRKLAAWRAAAWKVACEVTKEADK